MQTLPLITHHSLNQTIAWRKGTAISVAQFLADVAHLSSVLPPNQHILNVCRDRYHFTVGFAAAITSNKVSLLPPTHTPDMVRQLQTFAHDVFCLYDDAACDIALPKLRYPETAMPCSSLTIPQINATQLAAVVFTSGSTGNPVPHQKSWGALARNVKAQAARLGLAPETAYAIVGTIPPQHMYGFESTVLLPMQSGNALSSEQPFYPANIESALSAVPAPRLLVSTPLHLRLLLAAELQLPKIGLVLSATAPLSHGLAQQVESTLSAPLIEIYGSTETGQIATRRTTQSEEWQLFDAIKLTPHDAHYWADGGHIETPVALNDIIIPLSQGRFLLQGRQQDVINIAGKRNSLAHLNHQLNSINGVIDGVFFMPDEISHDHVTRLSACVVAPDLTAAQIMAELRTRIDAVFLPRPLLFVNALPRNSTGKLPRSALQALINKRLCGDLAPVNRLKV